MKSIDDLTPAERDEVQMVYLRRWLATKLLPIGSRRKTDGGGVVTRFTLSGDPCGSHVIRPPLSGNRNIEHCQTTLAQSRRKRTA